MRNKPHLLATLAFLSLGCVADDTPDEAGTETGDDEAGTETGDEAGTETGDDEAGTETGDDDDPCPPGCNPVGETPEPGSGFPQVCFCPTPEPETSQLASPDLARRLSRS